MDKTIQYAHLPEVVIRPQEWAGPVAAGPRPQGDISIRRPGRRRFGSVGWLLGAIWRVAIIVDVLATGHQGAGINLGAHLQARGPGAAKPSP